MNRCMPHLSVAVLRNKAIPYFFSVKRRPTDPNFHVFKKQICYEEGNDVVKRVFTFSLKNKH